MMALAARADGGRSPQAVRGKKVKRSSGEGKNDRRQTTDAVRRRPDYWQIFEVLSKFKSM